MNLGELWRKYQERLEQASPSPNADFRWLVEDVLAKSILSMGRYDDIELTEPIQHEIEKRLERRIEGEPVGYILGYWEFWGRRFFVGPGVLIPRPETECLIEEAMKLFARDQKLRFADFGSGTGCLALTLAAEFPNAIGIAIETSKEAAVFFKKNCIQMNLQEKVELLELAVESPEAGNRLHSPFDLIVMNPPYIADNDDRVDKSVRKYEPPQALFAADNGLQAIKSWIDVAGTALKSGGFLLCEFGQGQSQDVLEIVTSNQNFSNVMIKTDLSGRERYVVARRQ